MTIPPHINGMKLVDICARIDAHLKRFEADPKINADGQALRDRGRRPYYGAGCIKSGPRAFVTYVGYQSSTGLSKADALQYLTWLDAGGVGKHWKALGATSTGDR